MIRKLNIFLILLIVLSCTAEIPDVTVPDFGDNSLLSEADQIQSISKNLMEGVYFIEDGNDDFGDSIVVKWNSKGLSIFTGENTAYLVLRGGVLDSVLIFEGYWRFARGSETGTVQLFIKKKEGAKELLSGEMPGQLYFRGSYSKEESKHNEKISFRIIRKFNLLKQDFCIIAHRGGGRNVDRLPASENSIEIIEYSENLGANSIEIDVKITKDEVPILYHDEHFNSRLINGDFLIGPVSNYTFAQIRTFAELKNGEKIPSLKEALDAVLEKTELKLVWLDIKSVEGLEKIIELQLEYIEKAKMFGRDLEIMIGIPTEDVYNKFKSIENHREIPSLYELNIAHVEGINALVWAPRWTQGIQLEEVTRMHAQNRRVFTWTLDEAKFVRTYFEDGDFDGILSNYPTIVAFEYYMQ